MKTIARIAVRQAPSGDIILGFNMGALKPGKIYEIMDPLGDGDEHNLIVREVGDSCANHDFNDPNSWHPQGVTWGRTPNDLIMDGSQHLLTRTEWERKHLRKAGD